MKISAVEATEPRPPRSASFAGLFVLFFKIGVSSFGGGVSAWMHAALVERRGWLDYTEFSSALALARIMPGANIVNLAVLIGHRLIGFSGAVAAVAGLLIGMGLKSSSRIVRKGLASKGLTAHGVGTIAILVATFALIGVLRFPTAPTVLCLMPCSLGLAWFGARQRPMEREYDG